MTTCLTQVQKVRGVFAVGFSFCILLLIPGCGTEVGNGHSGPPIDGLTTKNHDDRGNGAPSANGTAAGTPSPQETAPADSANSASMARESLVLLAFNKCASPIQDHRSLSPVTLLGQENASNVQLIVMRDSQDSIPMNAWHLSVSAHGSTSGYVAKADANNALIVTNTIGDPLNVNYSCGAVALEESEVIPGGNTPAIKKSVMLTQSGGSDVQLTWHITGADENQALRYLEIRKDQNTVTLQIP